MLQQRIYDLINRDRNMGGKTKSAMLREVEMAGSADISMG